MDWKDGVCLDILLLLVALLPYGFAMYGLTAAE